jgi:O-antigen/teichoic acid export membrane protein
LPAVVIFTSMTAFISGFNSIHLLLLNRKLLLKKSVFIELTSQSIGLFVLIILAWRQRDIWALVEGNFVAALIKMLLSHSGLVPGRCRLQWEKQSVDEIVHFGKWIFLSSILGFLINQGDRLLLGGYVDNHTLGIYTVVFFLANAFKDILMRLIGSVFFPVLSEVVRNHPEKLAKVYYQIRHRIDTATMFVCGFLFANSQAIINFFYDNRYHDAGWMLQILSLSLIGNGYLLSTQCLLAKGLTKLEALQAFMQVVFFYTSFPIAYHYFQLVGAIWIIGTHVFFRVIISMIVMKKYLFLDLKKEFILLPVIFIGWITGSLFQVISYNLIHLAIKFIKQYDAESKSVLLILNKIYTALL